MIDKSPEACPVQDRERVTQEDLRDAGVDLRKDFPNCSLTDLRRYPVLSEGGWFIVIKDQRTLTTVCRSPWRLLGPISLASESLNLE